MLTGKDKHKMIMAAYHMCLKNKNQDRYHITSRRFEVLKLQASQSLSALTKGKPKHTVESKRKLSESRKGKPSPNKGKKLSKEQCERLSRLHTGRTISSAIIEKMLESRKWYKHSAETKAKISQSNKGKSKLVSQETKDKIAKALEGRVPTWLVGKPAHNRGQPRSQETKDKISTARKGKSRGPHSEETKARMRAARAKQIISAETKDKIRQKALARHKSNKLPKL
jgi:hypothetical protein